MANYLAVEFGNKMTTEQIKDTIQRAVDSIRSEQGKLAMNDKESKWIKTKLSSKGFAYGKNTKESGKLESTDGAISHALRAWHWLVSLESFEDKTGMKVGELNWETKEWLKTLGTKVIAPKA